jgi:hypothetical protein
MDTVTQRASVQKVQLAHRRALALSLRKQGASYRAIAQTLAGTEGVSPAYNERGAWEDVTGELRRLQERNTQTAADVQTLLMEQLKDLLATFWQRARQGDYAACDRVLAIMDRQAKLAGVGTDPLANLLKILDLSKLSVQQLERLASGDDLLRVLINQ